MKSHYLIRLWYSWDGRNIIFKLIYKVHDCFLDPLNWDKKKLKEGREILKKIAPNHNSK